MIDHRTALKPNTLLRLENGAGEALRFTLRREIGRGASSIVYEAARQTATGDESLYRVKEFYPCDLRVARGENGFLAPEETDAARYNEQKARFRAVFSQTNRLFYTGENAADMTNQLDLFELNGTSYVLSSYGPIRTLAAYRPSTGRECVSLARQTAAILASIHEAGFLYLDLKPENVLIEGGAEKRVRLFDFDSLAPMSALAAGPGELRLSFTRGWAPVELRMGDRKRVGPHTDVFGVGALLFFLLFGRAPRTPDCEPDAEYDFSSSLFGKKPCDDRLYADLAAFFHRSLAVHPGDRYAAMAEAAEALRRIERFADAAALYVFSSHVVPPICVGREAQLALLDRLLIEENAPCVFLSGMGGVGKTTLIKRFLCTRRQKFDAVLYMLFQNTVAETISDDARVQLSAMRFERAYVDGERYFSMKLRCLKRLAREMKILIVIDQFEGEADEALRALIDTGCRIVLVSRQTPALRDCPCIRVEALLDEDACRRVFETHLGRALTAPEIPAFRTLTRQVRRHTLVLELIAKQISASRLSVEEAARLTLENGFSAIAPEEVPYEKDGLSARKTVGNIIDALFRRGSLSRPAGAMLRAASLLPDGGMEAAAFCAALKTKSPDALNTLEKEGWITLSENRVSMHPVIRESVLRWELDAAGLEAEKNLLTYYYVEIRLGFTRNNYPRPLMEGLSRYVTATLPENASDGESKRRQLLRRLEERRRRMAGPAGAVAEARLKRLPDGSPADLRALTDLLNDAAGALAICRRDPAIRKEEIYWDLRYETAIRMPAYREEYVLSETRALLAAASERTPDAPHAGNPAALMRLCSAANSVLTQSGRFDEAARLLERARRIRRKTGDRLVSAIYYDMTAEYYDCLLNGGYDAAAPEERALLRQLKEAVSCAMRAGRHARQRDETHLYIKACISLAILLIRSGDGDGREIRRLLAEARQAIEENTLACADVRLYEQMALGWYASICLASPEETQAHVREAVRRAAFTLPFDLDKIDDVLCPAANMFWELGLPGPALSLLNAAADLCAAKPDSEPLARKKQEICDHVYEVCSGSGDIAAWRRFEERIRRENEAVADPGNRVILNRASET